MATPGDYYTHDEIKLMPVAALLEMHSIDSEPVVSDEGKCIRWENMYEVLWSKFCDEDYAWDKLLHDIETEGMLTPVHIAHSESHVTDGHHRLVAAVLLGLEVVPVIHRDSPRWVYEDDARVYDDFEYYKNYTDWS